MTGAPHRDELPGPRRSAESYDQSGEPHQLAWGDRMLIRCDGGPSTSRVEDFPPRLEIEERDGDYVLVDAGPREEWHYVFVPRR